MVRAIAPSLPLSLSLSTYSGCLTLAKKQVGESPKSSLRTAGAQSSPKRRVGQILPKAGAQSSPKSSPIVTTFSYLRNYSQAPHKFGLHLRRFGFFFTWSHLVSVGHTTLLKIKSYPILRFLHGEKLNFPKNFSRECHPYPI